MCKPYQESSQHTIHHQTASQVGKHKSIYKKAASRCELVSSLGWGTQIAIFRLPQRKLPPSQHQHSRQHNSQMSFPNGKGRKTKTRNTSNRNAVRFKCHSPAHTYYKQLWQNTHKHTVRRVWQRVSTDRASMVVDQAAAAASSGFTNLNRKHKRTAYR